MGPRGICRRRCYDRIRPDNQTTGQTAGPEGPELFVGLVGATGTDMSAVLRALEAALGRCRYATSSIRVIDLLGELPGFAIPAAPEDERLEKAMDAGDRFRTLLNRDDAVAMLAVGRIDDQRTGGGTDPRVQPRTAYLLRGFKRPEEVATLRALYGSNFLLVGAYAPRAARVDRLATRIARARHDIGPDAYRDVAEQLVRRDELDTREPHGQRLRETFALADVFLRADGLRSVEEPVERFVQLLFGHPYHTPTRDEAGMYYAHAAALRSAALGRQVGAAITTSDGSVIALGCNDVPRSGGGLYWCTDADDARDFRTGEDSSDVWRALMAADILHRLRGAKWLAPELAERPDDDLVAEALRNRDLLRGAYFDSVVEFGRTVHAEMAAITDASRRGIPTAGTTLYTTTFPCHNCARHIVAAGIQRMVFIEPYPKSRALDLHADSIAMDGEAGTGKVIFEPFVGVSPRVYSGLFTMPTRKDGAGRTLSPMTDQPTPRLASTSPGYLADEVAEVRLFLQQLHDAGLSSAAGDPR